MSLISYFLIDKCKEEVADVLGLMMSILTIFAYTGLVVSLSRDPVARDYIFHRSHTSAGKPTSNPYHSMFIADLIFM